MAAPHKAVGPKSDKLWRDALLRAVKRRDADDDMHAIDKLAATCVSLALRGDMTAMKEIGDRLDGKPAQTVAGEDGGPLTIVIRKFAGD